MYLFESEKGFTVVELMVVAAVIGILAAMAVPTYINMGTESRRNACITNLRQIDTAVERWSLDTTVAEGASLAPYTDEIYGYLQGSGPSCPSGGTYTLGGRGGHPQVRCNVEGHALP